MITALLIFLGFAVGWMTNKALTNVINHEDEREAALWAIIGVVDIVGVLIMAALLKL